MKAGHPRALPSPFLPILKTALPLHLGPQNEQKIRVLGSVGECWMGEQVLKVKCQK